MGEIGTKSLLGLPPVEKMAAGIESYLASTDKGNGPSLAKSLSAEIDMKLFYLDLINEMQEKYLQTKSKLTDAEKQLQLVRKDNVTMKKQLLTENLKNCGEESIVSKTEEEFFRNLGVTNDDGVLVDMGDGERKIIPQGPCMTFTNLFDLAGQAGFSFIFAR